MKKYVLLIVAAFLLFSCVPDNKKAGTPATDTQPAGPDSKSDVSYAFGVSIGTSINDLNIPMDYEAFLNGVKDVMDKKKPKFTFDEANQKINAAITAEKQKVAGGNLIKEKEFLEKNKTKKGVKTTASGLQYEIIKEANGKKPSPTDTVKVDYVGTLIDGTVFDSTKERKTPAVFALNQVIPGWTEAIALMSIGSKYRFYIPSALAYGTEGAGGKIQPNSTLIFEVDLLGIEPPAPAPATR